MYQTLLLILITRICTVAPVLYCYVCEDCPESNLSPLRHMRACPDDSYVSCIATLTTFAEYKTISRGCSRAPAVARRGRYNKHNGAICSQHTVNIMRATVCLCDRDTCNGPSLPPREMIEDDHDIIDIEEVVREMNQEPADVQPEAVSSFGKLRTLNHHQVFTIFMAVIWWKVIEGSF
eukprot:TRINITY_DN16240_c0_g1_i4.p1 TRINITY_DN16240_c0_g1~~TRINITY_DN16240_c0_g1_i4.p1  ORF type:complete len:178 (-),score=20.97 TRINITY_DN16240_c0_g1_i4:348-881(-)